MCNNCTCKKEDEDIDTVILETKDNQIEGDESLMPLLGIGENGGYICITNYVIEGDNIKFDQAFDVTDQIKALIDKAIEGKK